MSSAAPYLAGQVAHITMTFTTVATKALVDPATVALRVTDPTGALTVYTYAGAQIVKDSTGVYHYDLPLPTAGLWRVAAVGTGAAATTNMTSLRVDPLVP
jgi:uncharacterized protein YfaS (alpha-2-macroglobulin family)